VTKRLFLVRHAKSSHEDPTLKDFDRPLNERGKRDAPAMGSRLKNLGVVVDRIISSPSRRTRQTAKLMLERMAISLEKVNWEQAIYRCASSTLRERVREIGDGFDNVMIFGHNPSITSAANFFQKDTVLENVPTTGVVAIEFNIGSWTELDSVKGKLLFFERPKR
jgi:phosphohistidine phosphatase